MKLIERVRESLSVSLRKGIKIFGPQPEFRSTRLGPEHRQGNMHIGRCIMISTSKLLIKYQDAYARKDCITNANYTCGAASSPWRTKLNLALL